MFELVNEQQEEFCKVICSWGEYKFTDEYTSLENPRTQWL